MFKNTDLKFVSFGEVLFDVFNDEKKIGGAPLNVALRIKSFGFPVSMISSVGNDEDGDKLKLYIKCQGVNVDGIVENFNYKTSLVDVAINERGSATYKINHPVAWDKIELNNNIKSIVLDADVLVYGSLICRDEVSKNTLVKLLDLKDEIYKVFDANLRPPHYRIEDLKTLMLKSDFIKFNDEELLEISNELGSSSKSIEDNIHFIAQRTNTKGICVTKGKHGAVLLWQGELYYNAGFLIEVVDTVGAGDSFLASLITHLLSNGQPQEAVDFACAVGSIVTQSKGANPKICKGDILKLLNNKLNTL